MLPSRNPTQGPFGGFGDPPVTLKSIAYVDSDMDAHFRFVHCADLHLGSRFKGVSVRDRGLAEEMTESVFESFSRIVDTALSEGADFMVIAGDAFDESTITPATRSRLASELGRLGIPCFISRGNHDPEMSWADSIPYPDNVHEFGPEPENVDVPGLDSVEVVGVSFADWHEERNLPSLVRGRPDRFTVACMHCDVDSAGGEYAYSPCRLSDLSGRGVDYWAIGHIHRRSVLSTDPYVVYPGNIQGRKITESGEKGCYLVTVDSGRVSDLRFVPTQGFVWRDLEVDITDGDLPSLVSGLSGVVGRGDIVRFTFTGTGPMDSVLRLHPDETADMLSGSLGCTVCGLVVRTAPGIDIEARAGGSDMVAKVIAAGRAFESDGRGAFLETVLANPIAKRHRQFYESLTDEQIAEIVRRATGMLVASLEGSR